MSAYGKGQGPFTYGKGNAPLKGCIVLLLILNNMHKTATDRRWASLHSKTPPAKKPAPLTTLSNSSPTSIGGASPWWMYPDSKQSRAKSPHLSFCSEPFGLEQRTLGIALVPQGTKQFIAINGERACWADRPRQNNNNNNSVQ